jgi:hypothetical protein
VGTAGFHGRRRQPHNGFAAGNQLAHLRIKEKTAIYFAITLFVTVVLAEVPVVALRLH